MESAHWVRDFSGMSSVVAFEGICPHCVVFSSVCWTEAWLGSLASRRTFVFFLRVETLELIMEAEFERLRFFDPLGLLVSSDKTANSSCFGKGD